MTIKKSKAKINREPILEVRNISKRFPGVVALDDVSLKFFPGEIHAGVGENGAGKSTLMKILAGAYIPDKGEIILNGEEVVFSHPLKAQLKGVSIIYQEFNLLPERTVAQNIFLGREPSKFGLIDINKINENATSVLKEIGAEEIIDPTSLVGSLTVAEQQLVEIAKAISFESRVLIMDEPTAALTSIEVQKLNALVKRLKLKGMTIIFISHRLEEVFLFADKITVLKDGQFIKTVDKKEAMPSNIVLWMVGRDLDHYYPPLGSEDDFGEVILHVKNASNKFLKDITFELRKGEILGIAGLQGSGRTELAQALFGVVPFKRGVVEHRKKAIRYNRPAQAIKQKIGFVTEDRRAEGLFPNQAISDNILITVRSLQSILARILDNGIKQSKKMVPDLGKSVDIRGVRTYKQEVQYLSGGNQQKVVLAKWLASDAEIFIFDEPTRGIDVEAKASIHDLIRELTKKGTAIILISSELPEIIGMSDRILVIADGYIAGELPAQSSENEIMTLATSNHFLKKNKMIIEER